MNTTCHVPIQLTMDMNTSVCWIDDWPVTVFIQLHANKNAFGNFALNVLICCTDKKPVSIMRLSLPFFA